MHKDLVVFFQYIEHFTKIHWNTYLSATGQILFTNFAPNFFKIALYIKHIHLKTFIFWRLSASTKKILFWFKEKNLYPKITSSQVQYCQFHVCLPAAILVLCRLWFYTSLLITFIMQQKLLSPARILDRSNLHLCICILQVLNFMLQLEMLQSN